MRFMTTSHDALPEATEDLLPRKGAIGEHPPLWVQRLPSLLSAPWIPCALIGVGALGLDLYRLGAPSLWFDEAFSVELARQPLPLLWSKIFGPEPNMELYYLLLHFWLQFTSLFGLHATEFVVRFPSAIFAALSSMLVFLIGRRFLGTTSAAAATVLYALARQQLNYAQQTRAYSMQLFLICLACFALLQIFSQQTPQRRWWICYNVAIILALYTQLFSFLMLLSQLCAYAAILLLPGPWRKNTLRQWRELAVSLLVIGLCAIPMVLVSLQGSKTGWLPIPHRHDIYALFVILSSDSEPYMRTLFACLIVGLVVALLVALPDGLLVFAPLLVGQRRRETRSLQLTQWLSFAVVLLCWLIIPVAVSYFVSKGATRLFSARTLIVILPAFFLLAAMGLAVLRWRPVQAVLALALILLFSAPAVPGYYAGAQTEDWRSATSWIQQHYQQSDGLVCYSNVQGCQTSMDYYFHAYPGAAHFPPDSPGANVVDANNPYSPTTDATAAVDPHALARFGAAHPRIFLILGRLSGTEDDIRVQTAVQWLNTHDHLIERFTTQGTTILLYQTNASRASVWLPTSTNWPPRFNIFSAVQPEQVAKRNSGSMSPGSLPIYS